MIRFLLLITISLFSLTLSAQFGLIYNYTDQKMENWASFLDDNNVIMEDGLIGPHALSTLAIDYSIRPQQVRIEISPQIGYSWNESTLVNRITTYQARLRYQRFNIELNSQIYIFDIEGDCNCPTFAKSAPFWKKGFYLKLGMGYFRQVSDLTDFDTDLFEEKTKQSNNYKINIGFGLDMGVSENLTVSPYFLLSYQGATEMNSLASSNYFTKSSESSIVIPFRSPSLEFGIKTSYFLN